MTEDFEKDMAELGAAVERFNELFISFAEKYDRDARVSAYVQRLSDFPEDNRLIVIIDKFFAQFGKAPK